MSLAGRARIHGTKGSIYRPTGGFTGDMGRKVASWVLIATNVACLITSEGDEMMQKVFGTPVGVRDRGWYPGQPDLQPGDGFVAESGKRAGERWRIAARTPYDVNTRSAHIDAALVGTEEAIG